MVAEYATFAGRCSGCILDSSNIVTTSDMRSPVAQPRRSRLLRLLCFLLFGLFGHQREEESREHLELAVRLVERDRSARA